MPGVASKGAIVLDMFTHAKTGVPSTPAGLPTTTTKTTTTTTSGNDETNAKDNDGIDNDKQDSHKS